MTQPRITLVAALARGRVIGRRGTIPWHLPQDLQHFKRLTTGHPVVMGRVTWESLPGAFRPLPGRRNIVVTRNPAWQGAGAEVVGSLGEALARCADASQVFVIGGAALYAAALPLADELRLTEIDLAVDGDRFFPAWSRNEFNEVAREGHTSPDGVRFAFVTYERSRSVDDR